MNLISISDFRSKAAAFVNKASNLQQIFTIMQRSKPKAVLVSHEYFTSLEETVLDLLDSKEAEKAKKETTIKFNHYLKKRWPR